MSSRTSATPAAQWHLLRLLRTAPLEGRLPGFRQPVVLLELAQYQGQVRRQLLSDFDDLLAQQFPDQVGRRGLDWLDRHPVVQRVMRGAIAALEAAGIPLFSSGALLETVRQADSPVLGFRIALPCLGSDEAGPRAAVQWAVDAMNALWAGTAGPQQERLDSLQSQLGRLAPRGVNAPGLLQAADLLGVPWQRVARNVFQFGWGSKARWLDSTITDRTSGLGISLVRDKVATATLLRRAGLPVPEHQLVDSADQAVRVARRLAYPVVVKPADRDGGAGVAAGLKTDAAVRKAYEAARALSSAVLVERHFEGRDYRLQVYGGQVFRAVQRIPGGMTGDGVRDVTGLLAALNAQPERGAGKLLKPLRLDEEALELLAEQGLGTESVPERGRFVRLRRAANLGLGGTLVPVLEHAHPDNLALAVRAARLLRLDLAGVDLLLPDISRSWHDTGAAICEVNAQPQMSPHLPQWLLQQMLDGDGRIPIVLVLGDLLDAPWFVDLLGALRRSGRIGLVSTRGVELGQQVVAPAAGVTRGVAALLADPGVDAVLAVVGEQENLGAGLPVDRPNAVVLAATGREPSDPRRWDAAARRLAASSEQVLRLEGSRDVLCPAGTGGVAQPAAMSPAALAAAIRTILLGDLA